MLKSVLKPSLLLVLDQSQIILILSLTHGQCESHQYIYRKLRQQGMLELQLNGVLWNDHMGSNYSVLYELPCFDVVRYHVVDPMHNFFVGLAKHTTKQWNELGVLSSCDYMIIQDRVDAICVPSKIGRIPRKIASNFFSFTADEWKHWLFCVCLKGNSSR